MTIFEPNNDNRKATYLHNYLLRHFRLQEIKALCFGFGIEWQDLHHMTRLALVMDLIGFLRRQGKIDAFYFYAKNKLKLKRKRKKKLASTTVQCIIFLRYGIIAIFATCLFGLLVIDNIRNNHSYVTCSNSKACNFAFEEMLELDAFSETITLPANIIFPNNIALRFGLNKISSHSYLLSRDNNDQNDLSLKAICQPANWVPYTVSPGDNLTKLASWSSLSVNELKVANCIDNPNLIYAGQTIFLPPHSLR